VKRTSCLICDNNSLHKIIDLGNQPYADTFVHEKNLYDMLPVYNLSCDLCEECGQVQTTTITDPSERYNMVDYSYTSSNSSVATNHWKEYSAEVIKKVFPNKQSNDTRVCEIGSNDGYLLSLFQKIGSKVLGIDASEHVANIAKNNGIPTIQCIFDYEKSHEILENAEKFDLVMANNVFNHSDNPNSFAKGANNLLNEGGHFIFEVPYWKNTVDSHKIDQVYHEHVSYFTALSVRNIMEKSNFEVVDIEVVDYHGGSLRVYAKKTSDNMNHCDQLLHMIKKESYLLEKETYEKLGKDIKNKKLLFLKDILKIKNDKKIPIIAIGAAAKGNTFLNYMNLNSSIIDYVTDSSVYKQGKCTPLTNIKIVSDDVLLKYDEVYAIILSWNLSNKIKEKLRLINNKIKFINFYEDYK